MKELPPDHLQDLEDMDEDEKLDLAFHEMEMIYKTRCVDVPLTSNVRVIELKDKEEALDSSDE